MKVELRHLRYFVAVAEELHFRRAAERLYVTQPALSRQIAQLEHELGIPLFKRDRRRVELTQAGKVLLEDVRSTLVRLEQSLANARWAHGATDHVLRVGFPPSQANVVRPLLDTFRNRQPDVWLEEHCLSSKAQVAALRDAALDVGFFHGPVDDELLTAVPLQGPALTVALPSAHRLARIDEVPFGALASERLILPSQRRQPDYWGRVLAWCRAALVTPELVPLEESQPFLPSIVLPKVAAGEGIWLLPTAAPTVTPPGVTFRPVRLPSAGVDLAVVWRTNAVSPLVEDFVGTALETRRAQEEEGTQVWLRSDWQGANGLVGTRQGAYAG
jgi:DNA-binding transcriptional LysR family regulator